ncbi:MAG TPA: hypothetical protein VM123_08720 [archaeon]|nr:hypothetical protein [archaeon]
MAEEQKKDYSQEENKPEDPADQDLPGDDFFKGELEDQEEASEEEAKDLEEEAEDTEESDTLEPPDRSSLQLDSAKGPSTERFVDFDVWVATLEANFGHDFEAVLSEELGPDWVKKLDDMMAESGDFYKVIEELKREISGEGEEETNEGDMSFEALGPGEIIVDPSASITINAPGSSGGGRRRGGGSGPRLPSHMTDLTRKEFEVRDLEIEKSPAVEKLIDDNEGVIDGEVVLIDRSDYSRLSYFAHKELEKHKDDPKVKEIIKRKSLALEKKQKDGLNLVLALGAGIVLLYVFFSVISFFLCNFYTRALLQSLPPNLEFRPSTALHKQGALSRAFPGNKEGGEEQYLVLYFLRPALKRIDLKLMGEVTTEYYQLSLLAPDLLVIPRIPEGDSIAVRKHYSQQLPSNLGAFLKVPFFSLSVNGQIELAAYETEWSSLLPGLIHIKIKDSQSAVVAEAYVTEDRLNIQFNGFENLSKDEVRLYATRLVLLFSLLDI